MVPHNLLAVVVPLLSLSVSQAAGAQRAAVSGEQILSIAPASSTCAGAPKPKECRTADQAAVAISSSFGTYGITSPAEMAALTSLMAFETGDFKYNVNYHPGNPGQGTRNMQSAAYNLQYARSIPALSSSLQAVADNPNAVRDLLTANDALDFGSAAWFLTTICTDGIRAALQSQGLAGWQSYLTNCVGTAPTADRQAYWQRAVQVFGADGHVRAAQSANTTASPYVSALQSANTTASPYVSAPQSASTTAAPYVSAPQSASTPAASYVQAPQSASTTGLQSTAPQHPSTAVKPSRSHSCRSIHTLLLPNVLIPLCISLLSVFGC